MTKYILLIVILSRALVNGQNYCDCDSIKGRAAFTDFCTEYLDLTLKPVSKDKGQLKNYVYYFKGKKTSSSPLIYVSKNDKLFFEGKEVSVDNKNTLLNGLYQVKDKKEAVIAGYYFENGFCKKTVYKDLIVEFNYSIKPFRFHAMQLKKDGSVAFNSYHHIENGTWSASPTTDLMSKDPKDFNGVPADK